MALVGVIPGIFIAVGLEDRHGRIAGFEAADTVPVRTQKTLQSKADGPLALLGFVKRAWRPYDAVLGRIDGQKGYHDISRHPEARLIPGLVLFRWDAPLFFANAEIFSDHVNRAIQQSPSAVQWVVVAAEPVTDIDTTAADTVSQLLTQLAAARVRLVFAEIKDPVKDQLERYGLLSEIGRDHVFPTIGSAVHQYVAESGVDWVDWEDQKELV